MKTHKLTLPEIPAFTFHVFFRWNNCCLVFSHLFCTVGLYVTSNVVKLMFIALFQFHVLPWWCLVFVWMTLCTFYISFSACARAACDELWFISLYDLISGRPIWVFHCPIPIIYTCIYDMRLIKKKKHFNLLIKKKILISLNTKEV